MKRMIEDYIDRFYRPEDKRFRALAANNFALAREIVAWKESIVAAWDGIKVVDVKENIGNSSPASTGERFNVEITIDTNGINPKDLGVEGVAFRTHNGIDNLEGTRQFELVKTEGNIATYILKDRLRDAGVFRFAYRIYPKNVNLPHRQDFAYVRWI